MRRFILVLLAATFWMSASAQLQQNIDSVKSNIDNYRKTVRELIESADTGIYSDNRQGLMDKIEAVLNGFNDYLDRSMDVLSASPARSRSVNYGDFNFQQTPTRISLCYGTLVYESSPTKYSYCDGPISIEITPTRQSIVAGTFVYESTPVKSSYRKVDRDKNEHNFNVKTDDKSESITFDYFYIGINNFLNADGKIDQSDSDFMSLNSGRSIEVGTCVGLHRWDFARFLSLDIALDYRLCHYSFEKTFNLVNSDGKVFADYDGVPVVDFKRHNLRLQYISIPLTTEWRIGRANNPLVLHAGIEGSLRIGCREKQVYKIDGHRKVNRNRNDFETNFMRYAFNFDIGFKDYAIYCNYSPMQLFKNGSGPELYPISIGLRITID